MTYLKFYQDEHKEFETEFKFKVSNEHAKKIVRKLSLHFEFRVNSIRFYGNRQSGTAYPYAIRLSNNPNISLICHECAHLYNRQKTGDWGHNKKLMKTIRKFVRYSCKKGYWLNKTLTQNGLASAIETAKEEIRQKEIERQQKEDDKKSLIAFTKCGLCGFVMNWNLSACYNKGFIKWSKTCYAIDSDHEVTCVNCHIRSSQKVIDLKYSTKKEILEFTENAKRIIAKEVLITL